MNRSCLIILICLILALFIASAPGFHVTAGEMIEEPEPERPIYSPLFLNYAPEGIRPQVEILGPRQTASDVVPYSRVAYYALVDNYSHWAIYIDDSNYGSGQVRLTWGGSVDVEPALSRGSNRIAFVSDRDIGYQIFSINSDGSNLIQLSYEDNSGEDNGNPTWSPDGTRIAFESVRNNQADVYVMNADGSGQTRLTLDGDYDGMPAWSPDGSKIAFISRRTGGYRVYVMNTDGSGVILLSNQSYSGYPSWSPDGSQIAYSSDGDGDGWQELWIMNADGTNQRLVFTPGYSSDAYTGSFSPDGNHLGFTQVNWIQYEGNWYWTQATLNYLNIATGSVFDLETGTENWDPDWQTTDTSIPISSIISLSDQSPSPIPVQWSGTDAGPVGIENYDVQVKAGADGAWTNWLNATTSTEANYPGIGGQTYSFRVRARDAHGNLEAYPADYDAYTTIEALPPRSSVAALPAFSRETVTVAWGGTDPGDSGIQSYDIQYRDSLGGTWVNWQTGTTATSAVFAGVAGIHYDFRARATDRAQNLEAWPAGGGEAGTTFYSWLISGTVRDNASTPLIGVMPTIGQGVVGALPSDPDGEYSAFGANQNTYAISWDRTGYTSLPQTEFPGDVDATFETVLPPGDNTIADWGFESANWGTGGWTAGGEILPAFESSSYHTGANAARLGNQAGFLTPEIVVDDMKLYKQIKMAVGGGKVYLLWNYGWYQGIYAASRDENGLWSEPQQLSLGNDTTGSPYLFLDPYGNLHAFWREYDSLYYSRRSSDGNWSEPQQLASVYSGWFDIDMDGNGISHILLSDSHLSYLQCDHEGICSGITQLEPEGTFQYLRVVAEDSGILHVVWWDDLISYMRRDAGGNWSQTVTVSNDDVGIAFSPLVILVDSLHQVHLVWPELHESAWSLLYNTSDQEGNWNTPVVITGIGDYIYSDMTSSGDGTLHLVWSDQGEIFYMARDPQGSWSEASNLSNTTGGSLAPKIISDSNGRLHLTWVEYNGSDPVEIYYRSRQSDSYWSPTIQLSKNGMAASDEAMEIDERDTIHVAWGSGVEWDEIAYTSQMSAEQAGESKIVQSLSIPVSLTNPTLSCFYTLQGGTEAKGMGLSVLVSDGLATTTVFSTTTDTYGWIHHYQDFSPWAGQTITLTLKVDQASDQPNVSALLDEVTLGSAYPDLWISLESAVSHAIPGEEVVFTVQYGNRSSLPAYGVTVENLLPGELLFLDSSIPPNAISPHPSWDLGDLPSNSGPYTITITAKVSNDASPLESLTNTVVIADAEREIETSNNTSSKQIVVGWYLYLPFAQR